MTNDFKPGEQAYLNELVVRRSTDLPHPPWMQRSKARAIKAEARKLIGASPPSPKLRRDEIEHYNTASRVRATVGRGKGYKVHEAGTDGRPICAMGQGTDWRGETLGAGPVTCGKCAATHDT